MVKLLATVERAVTLKSLESKKEHLRTSEVEAMGKLEAIDAEIKSLMDSRDEISFDLRKQTEAIEDQELAIEACRGRVPKKVKDLHSHLVSTLKMSNTNRERLDQEMKVGFLEGLKLLQKYSLEKNSTIVSVISSQNDLPAGIQDERGRVHIARWEAYVANRLADLPEAIKQLEKMENEYQLRLAEINTVLNYWID